MSSRQLFWVTFILLNVAVSCGSEEEIDNSYSVEDFKKEQEEKKIKDSIYKANLPKPDTNLISNKNVVNKLKIFEANNPETQVRINTSLGSIEIELFEDTPLHRANFIMLVKKNYFDSTLIYRVVEDFMIQGGNSDRDNVAEKMKNIGFYTVPDEIHKHHYHKRGALAMAVSEQLDTPESQRNKFSSPYNFYIVQKGPLQDNYLKALIKKYDLELTEKEKSMYKKYGGTPHLDGDYTVFGQVTKGLNVIDKIAKLPTDKNERPLKDLKLSIEIIK